MENSVIRRTLHYLFVEDYLAKLICLAIGSGLWFYVEFARVAQTTLNIPIEYIKKPANIYLKQGQSRFIKVVVRGREEFLKFSTNGIKAEVNLAGARPGETNFPVLFDARQLPERVEIAEKPSKLQVALERGANRLVPIHPVTSGNPHPEWRVQRISVLPTQVEIDGPEAIVLALTAVDTEAIDIEGLQRGTSRKVNLRLPDQVSVDRVRNITVKIDVMQKTYSEERRFERIELHVQNLDAALNAAVSDTAVQILVQGEASALKGLSNADFYAFVNAEDTRYNTRTGNILPYATESGVAVKARLVSNRKKVQIVSVTPDNVNIRFSVKPEYVKKVNNDGTDK
jgi:YbbR domain-containing protein